MNKSHAVAALAGLLALAACSLEIPGPETPAPTTKPEYDVWNDDRTEDRHFDGNDNLLWIERLIYDQGQAVKVAHYSAADTLIWYQTSRWEQFGSIWRQTRLKQFAPPLDSGTLSLARSWSFDAKGNNIEVLTFTDAPALAGYRHRWFETGGSNARTLQWASYDAAGDAQNFERTVYDAADRESGWAVLDGDRKVVRALTRAYDANDHETEQIGFDSGDWSRTTHLFLPSKTEYRAAWYSGEALPPPAPGFVTAVAPVAASGDAATTPDPDPSNQLSPADATAGLKAPRLVAFPTLTPPTSWTPQAFEYYLPAQGSRLTLRIDGRGLPQSVSRVALGAVDAMTFEFAWNAAQQLTSRTVTYDGQPVLAVNLERDAAGRVVRVASSGTLDKLSLVSELSYADTKASYPSTMVLTTRGTALLTLGLTYEPDATSESSWGLEALNFDSQVSTVRLSLGGGETATALLLFEFAAGEARVYDILGKTDTTKVLKGRLLWTVDSHGRKTSFAWQTSDGGSNPTFTNAWTYATAMGTWATLPEDLGATADESVSQLTRPVKASLTLADSFDYERLFQLVQVVQTLDPAVLSQYQRTAKSLFDRVKEAVAP